MAAEAGSFVEESGKDEEEEEDAFGFGFDEETAEQPGPTSPSAVTATFQFIASKEFIELGAKVLVMPGGGPTPAGGTERGGRGVTGLEGFVGRAVEQS